MPQTQRAARWSGPSVTDRLLEQVCRTPGMTAGQLAEALFGADAVVSRVQFSLAVLESRGHIRRAGEGGRLDPFRYAPLAFGETI